MRPTGGLEADDMEAAIDGSRLRGEDPLDFLPHGQHEAADEEQLPHAHAQPRPLLGSRLEGVRPHAVGALAIHPLIPVECICISSARVIVSSGLL